MSLTEAGDRPPVAQDPPSADDRADSENAACVSSGATETGGRPLPASCEERALVVAPSGAVQTLYDERLDLTALGPLTIERASHVEPTPDGCWTADLSPVGGPVLGPFPLRSEALAAEVDWIQSHLLS